MLLTCNQCYELYEEKFKGLGFHPEVTQQSVQWMTAVSPKFSDTSDIENDIEKTQEASRERTVSTKNKNQNASNILTSKQGRQAMEPSQSEKIMV
jgi:GMP synthase-like glutamine amidotransferase